MWKPCGDTLVLKKHIKSDSIIVQADNVAFHGDEVFIVKKVGKGYVTEHGTIIPPEVEVGDKVIIRGKILRLNIEGKEMLLARAQDAICYERGGNPLWKRLIKMVGMER